MLLLLLWTADNEQRSMITQGLLNALYGPLGVERVLSMKKRTKLGGSIAEALSKVFGGKAMTDRAAAILAEHLARAPPEVRKLPLGEVLFEVLEAADPRLTDPAERVRIMRTPEYQEEFPGSYTVTEALLEACSLRGGASVQSIAAERPPSAGRAAAKTPHSTGRGASLAGVSCKATMGDRDLVL